MFPQTTSQDQTLKSKDLILPSLLVLAQAERLGLGPVSSVQLENALRPVMALSEADMATTASDNVSRFSRKLRNMVSSHQTLINAGLVKQAVVEEDESRVYVRITRKGQAQLFDHMLGMMSDTAPAIDKLLESDPAPQVVEGLARVSERSLVDVALLVLAQTQAANDNKPVSTTLLRRAIKALPTLQVSPEDTEVLAGRKDTKIDQILRNLLGSHKTLTRNRWARETESGLSITQGGKVRMLDCLLSNFPAPPLSQTVSEDPSAPRRRGPRP